jgi:hypothetical protein
MRARWPAAMAVAFAMAMPSGAEARPSVGPMPSMVGGPVPSVSPPPSASAEGRAEPSEAAAPVRVLVLPARVSGGLPPDTGTEVRTIVAEEIVAEGITVLPADASPVECDDACRGTAAQAAGADFVVQAQVVGDEDEFTVTVTLYGADGRALAPFDDECSICGLVEVRDMARLVTLDVRTEVLRRRRIDTEREPVVPVPIVPVSKPVIPRSPLVPAGWGLLGAGSAATIGGVVLLALHHRNAGCLDNPRGGECVPVRYTTAIPGAAVVGAGVAAVVGGVVMVVLGRRAERREAERAVAVRPHGMGLRVRF